MKKSLLIWLLVLVLCFSVVFAACDPDDPDQPTELTAETLTVMQEYIDAMYRNADHTKTFSVPAVVAADGQKANIKWTVNVTEGDANAVKVGEPADNQVTVTIATEITAAVKYTLTGTLVNENGEAYKIDGKEVTIVFERTIEVAVAGVKEAFLADVVKSPAVGTTYKLGMYQAEKDLVYYVTGETSGNYLATDKEVANAADVQIETAEGGYYIKVGSKYIELIGRESSSKPGSLSTSLAFSDTPKTVFTIGANNELIATASAEINGETKSGEFYLGSYSTYLTISASFTSYIEDTSKIDVSQFPLRLVTGAEVNPSEDDLAAKQRKDAYMADIVKAPAVGTNYKLALWQDPNGLVYYLTGVMGGYNNFYYAVSTDVAEAADAQLETAEGGYYIKVGSKYLTVAGRDNKGKLATSLSITDTPSSVFTIGSHQELITTVSFEIEGETKTGQFFLGNYGSYTDGSGCDVANLADEAKIDVDQYVIRFVTGATINEPAEEPDVQLPAADSLLTIEQVLEIGAAQEHNVYTENKYNVVGVIKEVTKAQYGNMVIVDAEGNELTLYGTYSADGSKGYADMDVKPVAGDTIKIYGPIGQYNGTVQIKNGWIVEHTPATPAEKVTTIEAALSAAVGTPAELTGTVTEITEAWSSYNNMSFKISDGTHEILVFRTGTQVEVGNTVSVVGTIGAYNSVNQIAQGSTVTVTAGGDTPGQDEPEAITTIAGALAAAEGASVSFTGTVDSFYEEWSSYGNCSPYVVDEDGNKILVFRTTTQVGLGDVISVTGTIAVYSNKNQVAQGSTVAIVTAHECTDFTPADCLNAAKCTVCGEENGEALGHTEPNAEGKCDTCGVDLEAAASTVTVSNTIEALADANGWANGTKYESFTLDENITVSSTGSSNTGKYYTSGEQWRIYQAETPSVTVTAATGYTIVSVKITYAVNNTGILTLDGANVASETVVPVNGSSITFGVGNTGSATNGQVRITAIEVVYAPAAE